VVWASDFPHFDSEFPLAKRISERKDLTDEQRNAVLCDAALHFFKLDKQVIEKSNSGRACQSPVVKAASTR
jgi:hypothetical protein